MAVSILKPYSGSRRTGFLLLDRPSLEIQTPSSVMFMGIIMRMLYEGVLKVIRRSRATLIFPMDVPMVKPRWVSEDVSSC